MVVGLIVVGELGNSSADVEARFELVTGREIEGLDGIEYVADEKSADRL